MTNNSEIQHKHMYSKYIGSLCYSLPNMYITLYLHRDFTAIREKLNVMKYSIELCFL